MTTRQPRIQPNPLEADHLDRDQNEYVVTLFAVVDYSGLIQNPVAIDPRVSLWIDWVENAEFVIVVNK